MKKLIVENREGTTNRRFQLRKIDEASIASVGDRVIAAVDTDVDGNVFGCLEPYLSETCSVDPTSSSQCVKLVGRYDVWVAGVKIASNQDQNSIVDLLEAGTHGVITRPCDGDYIRFVGTGETPIRIDLVAVSNTHELIIENDDDFLGDWNIGNNPNAYGVCIGNVDITCTPTILPASDAGWTALRAEFAALADTTIVGFRFELKTDNNPIARMIDTSWMLDASRLSNPLQYVLWNSLTDGDVQSVTSGGGLGNLQLMAPENNIYGGDGSAPTENGINAITITPVPVTEVAEYDLGAAMLTHLGAEFVIQICGFQNFEGF